jgi:hypothetical protein
MLVSCLFASLSVVSVLTQQQDHLLGHLPGHNLERSRLHGRKSSSTPSLGFIGHELGYPSLACRGSLVAKTCHPSCQLNPVQESKTEWLPKNTDFFDSLNVRDVNVERAWLVKDFLTYDCWCRANTDPTRRVNVGDDCFSPKTNLTGAHVNTLYCNGTHGQSMGSIGQYAGEKSIIEDVLIENVWSLNGQHAARLKSWAGPNVGYGYINNITYRNLWGANNEYTAFIDSW